MYVLGQNKRSMLSIGECMIEMTPDPDGRYRFGFAGDTLNTAWYARRRLEAGFSVSYYTAVGRDALSEKMLAFLRRQGIGTDRIRRISNRQPGLYIVNLDAAGERSFAYWRNDSAARCLADDRAHLEKALSSADVIYFSGITLAILPPPARNAFLQAISRQATQGVFVAFDPNFRRVLWESTEVMQQTIARAAATAKLVLPSLADEEAAFKEGEPCTIAERYHAAGASMVVVKNAGNEGLVSCRMEGMSPRMMPFSPARVAKVVDTTAAGDAFNGAVLASLMQGRSLPDSVGEACRIAGLVTGQRGALVDVGSHDRETDLSHVRQDGVNSRMV